MSTDSLLQEHLDSAIEDARETNPNLAGALTFLAGYYGLAAPIKQKHLDAYYQEGLKLSKTTQGSKNPTDSALIAQINSTQIAQELSQQKSLKAHQLQKRSLITFISASIIGLIGITGLIYGNNMNARANTEIAKAQHQQAQLLKLANENAYLNSLIGSLKERDQNLQQDLQKLQESELAKEAQKWREDYQELNQQFSNVEQKLNKVCSRKRVRFFASECKGRR